MPYMHREDVADSIFYESLDGDNWATPSVSSKEREEHAQP